MEPVQVAKERPDIDEIRANVLAARDRIGQEVYGNDDTVTLLFVALAAGGHVLIEGVPGVGKTTLANAFAKVVGLGFGRVQLTPDLLPADILGHSFYDQKSKEFSIRKGPVFTNVLLADELNRTPPRTQSALLEVMQEHQVTIEGQSMPVPTPFFVIATKNPIETEGVYPLPEAERDRFMVNSIIRYPERDVEKQFLAGKMQAAKPIEPLAGLVDLLRSGMPHVTMHEDVQDYLLDLVRATREHPSLDFGCSPRGGEQLMQAARAHALLEGRWFVVPDDVRDLVIPVMRHRVMCTADAEVQGIPVEDILDEIIDSVQVPITP